MKKVVDEKKMSSRVRFMLQDVIEWTGKMSNIAGPKVRHCFGLQLIPKIVALHR
jgi:hypothetical protein